MARKNPKPKAKPNPNPNPKPNSANESNKVCSSRNLGTNSVLAWKTGGGTHLTLIYLENVKRGFEQERAKRLAEEYLNSQNVPETLHLAQELGKGKELMWTERCASVVSEQIRQIQKGLWEHFTQLGFTVRALRPLHIDLRGQDVNIIADMVGTRDWHY